MKTLKTTRFTALPNLSLGAKQTLSFETLAESNLHCLSLLEFKQNRYGKPDFRVGYANNKLCSLLQLNPVEVRQKFLSEIYPFSDNWIQCGVYFRALKVNESITEEFPLEIYGSTRWYRHEIVPISKTKLLVTAEDITFRKQAEKVLLTKAYIDDLTGLKNRKALIEKLSRSSKKGTNIALVLLDIKNFKSISSCYGQYRADIFLGLFAKKLQANSVGSCYRLNSDLFAVLKIWHADEVALSDAQIKKWVCELEGDYLVKNRQIYCQLTVGYVTSCYEKPQHGQSLLAKAEIALESAKSSPGSDRVARYFGAIMYNHQRNREVSEALIKAISREEFITHYQPQFELKNGEISGYEALCRWINPELGRVSPDIFIAIAEKMNLLAEIDQLQMQNLGEFGNEICSLQAALICLSINASPTNIQNNQYLDTLISTANQLPKNCRLEVEITENVLVPDDNSLRFALSRLVNAGIDIALDDFGSGYSNLSYLSSYPFHKLKLDRTLLQGLEQNPRNEVLISATIDLAHQLGLKVVAEGIENAYQNDWLKQAGCDLGQGFYLSKPLDRECSIALLKSQNS